MPELFKIFEINLKLGASNLNFFEIGRVFKRVNQKIVEQDKLSGIFHFKFHSNLSQSDYNWLVIKGFFETFLSNFDYTGDSTCLKGERFFLLFVISLFVNNPFLYRSSSIY